MTKDVSLQGLNALAIHSEDAFTIHLPTLSLPFLALPGARSDVLRRNWQVSAHIVASFRRNVVCTYNCKKFNQFEKYPLHHFYK